jgi:hypothetical protein
MTLPGGRLRGFAARLCSPRTMDRLIDPVLADLQAEYRDARAEGRMWKSRWVRVAGYFSLLKAVSAYGCHRFLQPLHDWPADDRQALDRTIGFSAAAFVAVSILLIMPVLYTSPSQIDLVVFLIPQSLPIAVPVALTVGIICGLAGRVVSSRLTGAILALALVGSCVSLVNTAWIIPAAGQAYRESFARQISVTTGAQPTLTKGAAELTLSELSDQIDRYAREGHTKRARRLAHAYHMRWSLPCATFALALFALSAMPRRPVGRSVLGVAACATCLAYYALLFAGEVLGRQGALPAVAATWLPNVVFISGSAALLIFAAYRSGPIPDAG